MNRAGHRHHDVRGALASSRADGGPDCAALPPTPPSPDSTPAAPRATSGPPSHTPSAASQRRDGGHQREQHEPAPPGIDPDAVQLLRHPAITQPVPATRQPDGLVARSGRPAAPLRPWARRSSAGAGGSGGVPPTVDRSSASSGTQPGACPNPARRRESVGPGAPAPSAPARRRFGWRPGDGGRSRVPTRRGAMPTVHPRQRPQPCGGIPVPNHPVTVGTTGPARGGPSRECGWIRTCGQHRRRWARPRRSRRPAWIH